MPIIRIDFDDEQVDRNEMKVLSKAVQKIVAETTGIEDVFVYANSAEIKLNVAPIEIFVEMSAHKIKSIDQLMEQIKESLAEWKKQDGFDYPINLTIIPMQWKVEIGI